MLDREQIISKLCCNGLTKNDLINKSNQELLSIYANQFHDIICQCELDNVLTQTINNITYFLN